jgi:hypothetical protein
MREPFPKLLVATEFPPNASGGGPAVVRQMLREWPVEKLCWWSCLPERNQRFGQKVSAHQVAKIPPRLYPNERWAHQRAWLLENFWSHWAAGNLRATLATFEPEVIWVIPHAWAIAPLAKVLVDSSFAFHTTVQDFVTGNGYARRFGDATCVRLAAQADALYASATTRDATSHPMIADLRARTGADAAQMLHAGLEENDFAHLAQKADGPVEAIRIAYAGTIVVEKEFALFVNALKQVRAQLSASVTLGFFAAHRYSTKPWFDSSWMIDRGNLPEPALTEALRECSWGFAPMALTDDDPRYNRFSFPTKFISYLAAGLPVITLGHPEASVVKMAKTYRVGPCVTSGDAERLEK